MLAPGTALPSDILHMFARDGAQRPVTSFPVFQIEQPHGGEVIRKKKDQHLKISSVLFHSLYIERTALFRSWP